MKSILLCEGETDQIILSYYFSNQFSFFYDEDLSKKLKYKAKRGNAYSYIQRPSHKKKSNENELVIWSVEGRDNFPAALELVLKQNSLNTDRFYDRIIIVADKDEEAESVAFWHKIDKIIANQNVKAKFEVEDWFRGIQPCDFSTTRSIDFLMLNVPAEGSGALETFLLCALKERGKADKYIAQRAQAFVANLVRNQDKLENKYLNRRRTRTKAPLAVFFGITSPDRVFTEMNEMLESVNWANYKTIQNGFEKFSCFK